MGTVVVGLAHRVAWPGPANGSAHSAKAREIFPHSTPMVAGNEEAEAVG
jgi:hypothetical protein